MCASKITPPAAGIDRVREHFASWRKTKEYSSSPIPEGLWLEAVELAATYSVNEISKALRLDYNQLKRRVQAHEILTPGPANQTDGFVELTLSEAMSVPECTIELEHPDGTRMRMGFKGAVDRHLWDLAKAFWSRP